MIDRQPAHVIDLAATLLDLGRADYPSQHQGKDILPLAGRSLVPLLAGKPLSERPLFFEHEGNRAVRLGKWKTVWTNYQRRWELYNIDKDRSETNNLAEQMPDKVDEMEQLWLEWADSHFVERQRVVQPATGMPKIYYWREN